MNEDEQRNVEQKRADDYEEENSSQPFARGGPRAFRAFFRGQTSSPNTRRASEGSRSKKGATIHRRARVPMREST